MTTEPTITLPDSEFALKARMDLLQAQRSFDFANKRLGDTVAALDGIRDLATRFPTVGAFQTAKDSVEYGELRSVRTNLKNSKATLARAKEVWESYNNQKEDR